MTVQADVMTQSKSMRILSALFLLLTLVSNSLACRMWAIMPLRGDHLTIEGSDSLNLFIQSELEQMEKLGGSGGWPFANYHGWAWVSYSREGFYELTDWQRSELPAYEDSLYLTSSLEQLIDPDLKLYLGHVRNASSGAYIIPNPHPFLFTTQRGKTYAFGHNGDMDKVFLRDLLGPAWLAQHPPQTYGHGPWAGAGWDAVIDSELMFFWLIKCIEEYGDVLMGLSVALDTLEQNYSNLVKNFVLTDGESIWAYRSSPASDIWYYDGFSIPEKPWHQAATQHRAIMSTPPSVGIASALPWESLGNQDLILFAPGDSLLIIDNFPTYHRSMLVPQVAETFELQGNYPNPFNAGTWIEYALPAGMAATIEIHDIRGRLVKILTPGFNQWQETQAVYWDGRNEAGEALSSGVYLYSIRTQSAIDSGRMLLLR